MSTMTLKFLITLSVFLHLGGSIWHGDAHEILEIALPGLKMAFVVIVIVIGPIIGTALIWINHSALGCWITGCSMAGSVLFSVYHHYVLISIDNVDHLPPGTPEAHEHFTNSAELIALAALASAFLSFYAAGRLSVRDVSVA
jgi:hypothetical protein